MVDGINYLRKQKVPLSGHLKCTFPKYQSLMPAISYHIMWHDTGNPWDRNLVGEIYVFLVPKDGNKPYKELATKKFSAENHKGFVIEAREFAESLVSG